MGLPLKKLSSSHDGFLVAMSFAFAKTSVHNMRADQLLTQEGTWLININLMLPMSSCVTSMTDNQFRGKD
jgi:hypothetical protein